MRYASLSWLPLFLLVPAAGGCGSSGTPSHPGQDSGVPVDAGPASDLGGADSGADGEADGEPASDLATADAAPDAGGDAAEPDLGPGAPDLQFPDLGPLDLGLTGCQLHPCPGQQTCDAQGACREPAACLADVDCYQGRICTDGACSAACQGPADCPGVTWCDVPTGRCRETGSCETSDGCLAGNVCAGLPGRCVPALPPACSAAQPCPGGLLCGAWGECEEPWRCSVAGDCLTGRVCGAEGRCVVCVADDDCRGAQTCTRQGVAPAFCTEPAACTAAEDCLGTRSCGADGHCAPADPGGCAADPFEPDDAPGQGQLVPAHLYDRTLCDGETDRLLIAVPAGDGLVVEVRSGDGVVLDPTVTLLRADDGEPLAFGDRPGPAERAVLPLASVDTTVEVVVRGRAGDQGAYSISATLVPGGICPDDDGESHGGDDSRERARPITAGLLIGQLCPGDEDWLKLAVPTAGSRLTARLDTRQVAGPSEVSLYVDAGGAIAHGKDVVRENLAVGDVWLKVAGGPGPGDGGPYSLVIELAPPAPLARCAAAPVLAPGAALQGTTAAPGTTVNQCGPAGQAADAAPEAFYQFDVAADTALDLALSGTDQAGVTVALRSLCAEPASEVGCLAGEGTLHLPLLAAGHYVVVVEGGTAEAGAHFQLLMTTAAAETPPANDLCAEARPIPPPPNPQASSNVSGTLLHAGHELDLRRCDQPEGLPDVFYTLQLDAPALLTATTDGSSKPWLTLIGSCVLPVELACAAPGRKLMYNDLPAGSYVLVAEGVPGQGEDGTFVVRVNRGAVAGPDTCMGARPIGLGAVFNEQTAGISKYNLTNQGCTGGLTAGPDMPFLVHLQAGQTLKAELLADWDGALYLVRDCEDVNASCVAGKDENGGGVEETLSWTADQTGDYFLIVDAYSRNSSGQFRLTAAVDGECLAHRDCAAGFRCVSFHCVRPECQVDGDCPLEGSVCEDERCVAPECSSNADCAAKGMFCADHHCAPPPGEGLGSGLLALPIPDDDPNGLTTALVSPDLGPVAQVLVEVELDHPYQGDLVLALVSPAGTRIRLHNQTGGNTPFGTVIYGLTRDADGPGQLDDLAGEGTAGPWLLEVQDLSSGDQGVLQAWALYLVAAQPL